MGSNKPFYFITQCQNKNCEQFGIKLPKVHSDEITGGSRTYYKKHLHDNGFSLLTRHCADQSICKVCNHEMFSEYEDTTDIKDPSKHKDVEQFTGDYKKSKSFYTRYKSKAGGIPEVITTTPGSYGKQFKSE